MNQFLHKLKNTLTGGAIIISFFSIVSRILGLLRDRLLASSFGAGDTLDTYYAAFRIPDLVFNTLILGALSASFIPIFLQYYHQDKNEVWKIVNSVLNILGIIVLFLAIIFFIFAPQLVPLIVAPGFALKKQLATIALTRVMLASIFFFTISNIASSILNAFKKFVAYSLAPVFYNLGIIFGIVILVPIWGIKGLAWGVVIGALLHLLIQVPSLIKTGFKWKFNFDFKNKAVRKIGLLMVPRTIALGITQINKTIITVIASLLASGTIAVYNLADNLQNFPIGIFAIPLAIACFPYLSESVAKNEQAQFAQHFSATFRRILFLIIPASFFVYLLRAQIVRLILGAGMFTWHDTVLTLNTLGFFALSLFAQSLIPLLARSFYALQDTKTPLYASLFSLVLNIVLALLLGKNWGAPGLALAFSLSSIVNFFILFFIFKKRISFSDEKKIYFSFLKIVFISLISVIFLQTAKYFVGGLVNMDTFAGVLIQFIGAIAVGIIFYLILALILKLEEIEILRPKAKAFFKKFKIDVFEEKL